MKANYFFIDGSALTAQIRQLQRAQPIYRERKLCPRAFLAHFLAVLSDLHEQSYKRATLYFPKGDETAIEQYILVPDRRLPGVIRDLHFKFCGRKLKKSAEFDKFVEEKVPLKFQNRFSKSEKGIDIEMCCDALRLASAGQLERLFLLTNDGDFVPLCKALKEFGANISILHLSTATQPNDDLLGEADSYDIVTAEALDLMFFPHQPGEVEEVDPLEPTASGDGESGASPHHEMEPEKPDAEPSDMEIGTDADSPSEKD